MAFISDDGDRARDRLDTRIAFAAAAFALAYGFAALLDRIGAPVGLVEAVAPAFTVAALATLGVLLHSMRISTYYAAERAAPAEYAGLAQAALIAGLIAPFAADFAARPWALGICGGVFMGVALLSFWAGPLLRRSGAFSLPGFLAARFPDLRTRLALTGFASAASALAALGAAQAAVGGLTAAWGGSRPLAATLVGLAALAIAGAGGLRSAIWTASAAGAVALLGLGWPVLGLATHGAPPFDGEGWAKAARALEHWGATAPLAASGFDLIAGLALSLGVATLAPLIAPAVAVRDETRARVMGAAALFWTLLLAFLLAAVVAGTALSLTSQTIGQAPARLPDPIYGASGRGDVRLCGASASTPVAAATACNARGLPAGAPLRDEDVRIRGDFPFAALAWLEHMGAATAGLMAAAQTALGLALAAAALHSFGTMVSHEAIYHLRGETDLTSRRLATTRLALLGLAVVAILVGAYDLVSARTLAGLAISLSAAAIAPVAALALWPRASAWDALVALITGGASWAATIALLGGAREGAGVAADAAVGAALALAAGSVSALVRPRSERPGAVFLARLAKGDGVVVAPDKGA